MGDKSFGGDKKMPLRSPLAKMERRFIDANLKRVPGWGQGYHLTLASLAWSAGLIFSGYMALQSIHWLWLSSCMLFLQWLTDSFDGALGRARDTGIPRWGYYMDHLLDYVFMTCLLLSYAFLVGETSRYLLFVLVFLFGIFMVNSFLFFGTTGQFKITYLGFGPTEMRILFITFNSLIVGFGPAIIEKVLPFALVLTLTALCTVVYRTQKRIWKIDRDEKRKTS